MSQAILTTTTSGEAGAAQDAIGMDGRRGAEFGIREVEQRAGELINAANGQDLKKKMTTKNKKWCKMHKGIPVQMLEQRCLKSVARSDFKREAHSRRCRNMAESIRWTVYREAQP
ncbi:hypothetical protein C8J57DRAFT_1214163 [Mycena rebaudengoi]|nr:hypothetical protein C8J57DRAFT_1214163 [Mycena rebaudengoi]